MRTATSGSRSVGMANVRMLLRSLPAGMSFIVVGLDCALEVRELTLIKPVHDGYGGFLAGSSCFVAVCLGYDVLGADGGGVVLVTWLGGRLVAVGDDAYLYVL